MITFFLQATHKQATIGNGKAKTAKVTKNKQQASALGSRTINGVAIEKIYTKKTQLEHILLRPDTYIGSTEKTTQDMWVYDEKSDEIIRRSISIVPGLYKIFDEIIVNAADNKQRDSNMTKLKVILNEADGVISVWNNGRGVPIAVHSEHGVYVPELIFGHLLTGSNFDDNQKKTTGGRNGYGAKLANIFSTEFVVETADRDSGKYYMQTFRDNMGVKDEPTIKPYEGDDFTCITFKPDWQRFSMEGLDDDSLALMRKRVYDVAGCMAGFPGRKVRVYLGENRLAVNSFPEYIALYQGLADPVVCERVNDQWEVAIAPSDGQYEQVSFVNAICTTKGGQHANFIADQITAHLVNAIKKKAKGQEIRPHHVKNHLCIYVNSLIENPAFDSQTKETLTTRPAAFGGSGRPLLSSSTLKALEKSEVVESVLSWAKFQATKGLSRKSGKKTSRLSGVTKLDDANFAGTGKSADCTLILTEGDSAKTLAVSGLGIVGRDYFGVFPLKGKLLNVRDSTPAAVIKNEEIGNIVKILGLKFNQTYEDNKSLRYGHLMIMTDQDHDGSHIKGLIINFLHHFWPSLLKIDGFLKEFITPIVKCTKSFREKVFFTLPEYELWREGTKDCARGWTIKYYKGLGTSTAKEAKEYFARIDRHLIEFQWSNDTRDADLIDMAFAKKRVEDRKDWLSSYRAGTYVDYNTHSMSYDNFINKELIVFSMEDNKRSIPCMVDGLKPSQRKVLYACFKRKLKNEIKVAQLAGYVSEHAAYHHGEVSLTSTIVGMAQNFVASNNINLLNPSGQFGTRLMGGKDSASARYIFTRLEKITRLIFHADDDPLLDYLNDDGLSIEPVYYVPIIPFILVNGSDGIGTGYSSQVPNYSPRDLIANIRRCLSGLPFIEMQPWYRGFIGDIRKKGGRDTASYVTEGFLERTEEDTIHVTELPIKRWTQDYKIFLESMLPGAEDPKAKSGEGSTKGGRSKTDENDSNKTSTKRYYIKDFKENHTDTTVNFTVTMAPADINAIEREPGGLRKFFRMDSSVSTSNMQLFDPEGTITKYPSPSAVLERFYNIRSEYYVLRKAHLLSVFQKDWSKLDNKVRFINAVVDGYLKINNRKKADLLSELKAEGYDTFHTAGKSSLDQSKDSENKLGESDEEDGGGEAAADGIGNENDKEQNYLSKGYDYLLSMKIWSLTKEQVVKLEHELETKTKALDELKATPPEEIWKRDLDAIETALDECDEAIAADARLQETQRNIAGRNGLHGGRGKGRKAAVSDEDDDFNSDVDVKVMKKKAPASKVSSKAPAAPSAHSRSTETNGAFGKKVSTAFANAEAQNRIARTEEDPLAKFSTVLKIDDGDDQDERSLPPPSSVIPHESAAAKPNKGLSLMDRIQAKYQIQNAGLSSVPTPKVASKFKKKPTKRSTFIESDEESNDAYDIGSSESEAESRKKPPIKKERKVNVVRERVIAETTKPKTKPKASAATTRKPQGQLSRIIQESEPDDMLISPAKPRPRSVRSAPINYKSFMVDETLSDVEDVAEDSPESEVENDDIEEDEDEYSE